MKYFLLSTTIDAKKLVPLLVLSTSYNMSLIMVARVETSASSHKVSIICQQFRVFKGHALYFPHTLPPSPPFFRYSGQVNKFFIHSKLAVIFTWCQAAQKKIQREQKKKKSKKKEEKIDFLAKACTKFPGSPRGRIFSNQNIPYGKKAYEK